VSLFSFVTSRIKFGLYPYIKEEIEDSFGFLFYKHKAVGFPKSSKFLEFLPYSNKLVCFPFPLMYNALLVFMPWLP